MDVDFVDPCHFTNHFVVCGAVFDEWDNAFRFILSFAIKQSISSLENH